MSLPIIMAFLAAVCFGISPVISKLGLIKTDPFTALAVRSAAVTAILFLGGLSLGKFSNIDLADKRSYFFIVLEGILAALLGQLAYYYAQKFGEVSRVAPIVASFPVITMVLAFVLLDEKFTWPKLAGTLLIIAGVMLIKR